MGKVLAVATQEQADTLNALGTLVIRRREAVKHLDWNTEWAQHDVIRAILDDPTAPVEQYGQDMAPAVEYATRFNALKAQALALGVGERISEALDGHYFEVR